MRPILVTPRIVESDSYAETRDALDVRWPGFLGRCGLLPVMVPSGADVEPYFERFRPAGVLLTGGNDLACVADGPLSRRRDEFEQRVLDAARRAGLPLLGVCRGLQFLGWTAGFSLRPLDGHVATRHRIEVAPGSRFLRGSDGREVNSFHSHGLSGSGPEDWVVAARAADGAIEAVEHRSLPILGVMWHPEREAEPLAEDVALFRVLFGVNDEPASGGIDSRRSP